VTWHDAEASYEAVEPAFLTRTVTVFTPMLDLVGVHDHVFVCEYARFTTVPLVPGPLSRNEYS
jgi:hypothetical protein